MEITITDIAAQKIAEKKGQQEGFLKLKYDTEGCGCVVSGVTVLWLVDELHEEDRAIETSIGPIYVEKSKEVFLNDNLKIDFSPSTNSFQLKSPGEYLNPRMSFLIKIN